MTFELILMLNMAVAQNNNCGKVVKVKGMVSILRVKGEVKPNADRVVVTAKKKTKLLCSDVVVTEKKSRAKLKLDAGKVISMGQSARLEIWNFVKGRTGNEYLLKLLYGKVRSVVNPQKNKDTVRKNLKIQTPVAVAGVRGTDFYLSHDPNHEVTNQVTLKGEVEVALSKKENPSPVIIRAGQQAQVRQIPQSEIKGKDEEEKKSPPSSSHQIQVIKIQEKIIDEIKQVSMIVKNDKEFTQPEVLEIIGPVETWDQPRSEIPKDLEGIKEEF